MIDPRIIEILFYALGNIGGILTDGTEVTYILTNIRTVTSSD